VNQSYRLRSYIVSCLPIVDPLLQSINVWCWQSIKLNRKPKEDEITTEVVKEYQRQEEAKRIVVAENGQDVNALSARVTQMEGSMTQLQRKIDSSHGRLEGMMREFLNSQTEHSAIVAGRIVGTTTTLGRGHISSAMALDVASPTATITDIVQVASPEAMENNVAVPITIGEPSEVATDVDVPLIDHDDMLGVFTNDVTADFEVQQCTQTVQSIVTSVGGHNVGMESTEGALEEGQPSTQINAAGNHSEQVHKVHYVI